MGTHQYATGYHWATSQVNTIKQMYDNFPNAILTYDAPVYKSEQVVN